MWKSDRRYPDFQFGNSKNLSCEYPTFWGIDGYPVGKDITQGIDGCRISEFDQVCFVSFWRSLTFTNGFVVWRYERRRIRSTLPISAIKVRRSSGSPTSIPT